MLCRRGENLLGVDAQVIEEQTPVCEEVVRQMVAGANKLFNTDYAVAISGYAGPGGPDGGKAGVIVGTIWIAVGDANRTVTLMIEEDNGRDKNLALPTSAAMHMLLDFLGGRGGWKSKRKRHKLPSHDILPCVPTLSAHFADKVGISFLSPSAPFYSL